MPAFTIQFVCADVFPLDIREKRIDAWVEIDFVTIEAEVIVLNALTGRIKVLLPDGVQDDRIVRFAIHTKGEVASRFTRRVKSRWKSRSRCGS